MTRFAIVFWIVGALVSSAVAEPAAPVIERPKEFVDETHESSYENYEARLKSADERAERNQVELARVTKQTIRERITELAGSLSPDRVREVKKITDGWFDAEEGVTIGEDVPEELADIVKGHESATGNIEMDKQASYRMAYRSLRGQWLQLAEGHAADPEGEDKADTLHKLVADLEIVPDALHKYGDTEIAVYRWDRTGPHFTEMSRHGDELFSVTFHSGTMAGGAERMRLGKRKGSDLLGLDAHTGQPNLKGTVYGIRHPQLKVDDWKISTMEIWRDEKKKKLIHKSKGFCYLAGIWGSWGNFTNIEVKLDPDDGFYYLHFRSENLWSGGRAVIVEFPETDDPPKFSFSTVEWERGDPVKELIDAKDGICLFTGMSGAFTPAEVKLTVGQNGKWQLGGRSAHVKTGAQAMVLRFE